MWFLYGVEDIKFDGCEPISHTTWTRRLYLRQKKVHSRLEQRVCECDLSWCSDNMKVLDTCVDNVYFAHVRPYYKDEYF